MDWSKIVGPATLVYLVSATVAGVWWASDLSTRVSSTETQVKLAANTAERITRVETILLAVDKQLDKIDDKLDRQQR